MAIFEATFVTLAFANAFGYALLGARARRLAVEPAGAPARQPRRRHGADRAPARRRADRAGGLMLKVRVIPCLDVKDGPRGQGRELRRSASTPATRSRRRAPTTRPGRTSSASSTSPRAGRTAARCSTSPARTAEQCFMPLTVGGGVRTPEDVRALLLAGADKVSFNTAAVADPDVVSASGRASSATSASSWRSTPAPWRRAAGRSSPTAARGATGIDAVAFAREMERRGAGEILLTSMDRDGTKRGLRPGADPRGRRRGRRAGDRVGRRRDARAPGRGGDARATPRRCSPPRSSTSARHSIAEAKAAMAAAGIPVRP